MPTSYICQQAKLLYTDKDPFKVLQNIRDKYTTSSFPSQMTRVKQEWFNYKDRHASYDDAVKQGYASLKEQNISSRYLKQFLTFQNDPMKEQIKKVQQACQSKLTGSRRTDAVIAKIKIMPEYMSDYRLTQEDLGRIKECTTTFLENRAMNCIDLRDADELLSNCRSILKKLDDDIHIIAAALAVVSGRRSIEILKTGNFNRSKTRGSYAMLFDGTAKKRDREEGPHDVPLLIKYKYVRRALDHVRSKLAVANLSNAAINAKLSHKLGDAAKVLTSSLATRFHDLRAMYGCMTHLAFSNNCSINIWLKHVLLHDTIDTSVFYSRCKISKCNEKLGSWKF